MQGNTQVPIDVEDVKDHITPCFTWALKPIRMRLLWSTLYPQVMPQLEFLPIALLMTCQIMVKAPDGSLVKARALLDSGSSPSFVSKQLTQSLSLSWSHQNLRISGVAGLFQQSQRQSVATFEMTPVRSQHKRFAVSAIVVPRVTCDLPLQPVHQESNWIHISDISLLTLIMVFQVYCSVWIFTQMYY